jgi:hypothetical protein
MTLNYKALWLQACDAYDRKNRSGCCCAIDEQTDELRSACAMHVEWRDDAVAAEQNRTRVFARWAMEALLAMENMHDPSRDEDGGEHVRMLMDRGRRLVDAVVLPTTEVK